MKKLIVVIMFIISAGCVVAQHTADLGVQVGAATYWGSIKNIDYAKSITPVVGALGRWNFNKRLAFRGQLLTGNLKADGFFNRALIGQPGTGIGGSSVIFRFPVENYPNALTSNNPFNFNRNFQSVEGLLEFNFRNYKMGKMNKEAFTPFVALGLGAFYSRAPRTGSFILVDSLAISPLLPETSSNPSGKMTNGLDILSLTIPVGAGLKFNITKRLGGMAEVIVRKTFSDNIDNLNDPARFQNPNGSGSYASAKKGLNNTDWYATLSFSLYYELWNEKGNCALYDKLKRK